MSSAKKTTDHDEIRKWVEQRDGRPSVVRSASGDKREGGVLRIDFGEKEDELDEIAWEDFFKIFDDSKLAFLHQDKTEGGKPSRFNKFVAADGD